jgi:ribosomal protein S18 acetylase RimI-like enzyme
MTIRRTLTIGRQRVRVGPWHADPEIAHVMLIPHAPAPTTDELRTCIDHVRALGYRAVLTSAVESSEAPAFLAAGFVERDRLVVLSHDLSGLEDHPGADPSFQLRRGRRGDRRACLALDSQAFPPFWRLDEGGLADARSATPTSRFRVAVTSEGLLGYAVTGRSGSQGFLQRLATDPEHWGEGIGTALTLDGLRWCTRRRVAAVFVNTQVTNDAALSLYEHLGFRATPNDMVVLLWEPS